MGHVCIVLVNVFCYKEMTPCPWVGRMDTAEMPVIDQRCISSPSLHQILGDQVRVNEQEYF